MNTRWLAVLICVAAGTGCAPRKVHVFQQPPQSAVQVLTVWMAKNCKVGEENDLEQAMRRFGTELTPLLRANFENGPSQERLRDISSYARSNLYAMQQRIRAGDSLGLSPAEAQRIGGLDQVDYAQRAAKEFVKAYKSTALAGLGAVRTPAGVAYLSKEAADNQSEFSGLAAAILIHFKQSVPQKPRPTAGSSAPGPG